MLLLENVQKTFNAGTVNEKKALTGVNLNMNSKDFVTVHSVETEQENPLC